LKNETRRRKQTALESTQVMSMDVHARSAGGVLTSNL